jgi:hypothetical protein
MAVVEGEVVLYDVGLVHCSVCAAVTVPPDEVALRVNMLHPAGGGSLWHISKDDKFADGMQHPRPCDQEPDDRRHWLLDC